MPTKGGEVPPSTGDLLLQYRLRTVRIGNWTTVVILAALVGLVLIPRWSELWPVGVPALLGGLVRVAVVFALPWERLFARGSGTRLLCAWTASDIVLITLGIALTGGADSELYLLYGLSAVYAATTFGVRTQAALLAWTIGCYTTTLAVLGWHVPSADLALRLVVLLVLGFVAAFVSYELHRQMGLHRHAAHHDSLTGLPNRVVFYDRLRVALDQPGCVAVLVIDLDGFKQVNDTYGHLVGDEVLRALGARLRSAVRSTDTVARLGGDEFAVLLAGIPDREAAVRIAGALLETLRDPVQVGEVRLRLSASLGVAVHPEHGPGVEALVGQADLAMYEAKSAGGGYCLALPDAA
jgi:diguanylate cyclase (GGDEF)-like protein